MCRTTSMPSGIRLQQLEAAAVGVDKTFPLHSAQLPGKGAAVAVEVVRQLDAGEGDAEGQAVGAGGLAEQISCHLGAQALHHQQVDAAGEGKIFIADGAHQIAQCLLVRRTAIRKQ